MLNFKEIKNAIEKHFTEMTDKYDYLYAINLDKDELWEVYMNAIPPQHNKIYRVRREYDCSCCRHFVKQIGNVVGIKDCKVESIWDITTENEVWNSVCETLSEYVKSYKNMDIYFSSETNVGTDYNMDMDNNITPIKWEHFFVKLPQKYVKRKADIPTFVGRFRDNRNVFKRSLDEFTLDAINTVLELINQGSLYRGDEYKANLVDFRAHKIAYDKLNVAEKELYAWEHSVKIRDSVSKIRNTAIGTLLTDVSNEMQLDEAVRKYEAVVAPANYKRSKPIFTQRMLEEAQKTITELGYLDSLKRRYANPDDITVNNILFSNRDASKRIQGADDIFASLAKDTKKSSKRFSKVEEISIDDFIKNVLPTTTEVEAYVENKHASNFVSLIAPVDKDSKTMFKWNNNFSWAYSGNVTDSILKQNVKNAGGKVDGVLRFSIMWNDGNDWNRNDEDAHCIEPNGTQIYYGYKRSTSGGNLDVDIINPKNGIPAVENITWASKDRMKPGTYKFYVHTFSGRGGRGGFRAEVECNGEIHSYDYSLDTRGGKNVDVAEVILDKDGNFTVKDVLSSNISNRDIWNISTNDFVPVNVICYSPNYWDEQHGIGNKHYFFMLKGCVNPEMPNGWYNEFLNSDLYPAHRKVMEAMATKAHVEECDDQLSGLGFSSTVRNDLVVKVKGSTERVLKIKF